MYSKTHMVRGHLPQWVVMDLGSLPRWKTRISPGVTSRMNLAATASSAQLSEATT